MKFKITRDTLIAMSPEKRRYWLHRISQSTRKKPMKRRMVDALSAFPGAYKREVKRGIPFFLRDLL